MHVVFKKVVNNFSACDFQIDKYHGHVVNANLQKLHFQVLHFLQELLAVFVGIHKELVDVVDGMLQYVDLLEVDFVKQSMQINQHVFSETSLVLRLVCIADCLQLLELVLALEETGAHHASVETVDEHGISQTVVVLHEGDVGDLLGQHYQVAELLVDIFPKLGSNRFGN